MKAAKSGRMETSKLICSVLLAALIFPPPLLAQEPSAGALPAAPGGGTGFAQFAGEWQDCRSGGGLARLSIRDDGLATFKWNTPGPPSAAPVEVVSPGTIRLGGETRLTLKDGVLYRGDTPLFKKVPPAPPALPPGNHAGARPPDAQAAPAPGNGRLGLPAGEPGGISAGDMPLGAAEPGYSPAALPLDTIGQTGPDAAEAESTGRLLALTGGRFGVAENRVALTKDMVSELVQSQLTEVLLERLDEDSWLSWAIGKSVEHGADAWEVYQEPLDYMMKRLPFIALETYLNRFQWIDPRVEILERIRDLHLQAGEIVMAHLRDEAQRLRPFYWMTAAERMRNLAMISAWDRELTRLNVESRLRVPDRSLYWRGNRSGSSLRFNRGTAYRQLEHMSRHGWEVPLNENRRRPSGEAQAKQQPPALLQPQADIPVVPPVPVTTVPATAAIDNGAGEDDFSDIDASLQATITASDRAMENYQQKADSSGLTARLRATAENNMKAVERMQALEAKTLVADIAVLAAGVAVGAIASAAQMAMQARADAPAAESYGSGGGSGGSSGSGGSFSVGGSWDGMSGQTLFSR